jgi:hypothetical protein
MTLPVFLRSLSIGDVEILGRPVRMVHAKEGVEIAIESMKREDEQFAQLLKMI